MNPHPNPSALDQRTQAFPALTEQQIARVGDIGRPRTAQLGDILFAPGDTSVPFFLLLSGRIEIVQPDVKGERTVAIHDRRGEFTGEISMISGQRCLVLGRVTEPSEVVEINDTDFRALVARDAELSEILLRAFILRRLELIKQGFGNLIVMGSRHSAGTLEIRGFLSRNGHPYSYIDLDTDEMSQELLDRFQVTTSEVPIVIAEGGTVLKSPSIQEIANILGLNSPIAPGQVRDVIIVGAGPAGLAAAVYGASEGLDTLLIETQAPGGQAGSSSKIENYLGFPTGISGQELASRATTQSQKFGAQLMIARSVRKLDCSRQPYELELDSGDVLQTKSIVIATGARYNKLRLANLEAYEGKGIYYAATHVESQLCETEGVAVVGGGNSAGQAAVFFSQSSSIVHMLVRSGELRSTMSKYLIQRITENPRIQLHYNTEIVELLGDDHLEQVTWLDKKTGEKSTHKVRHLFVMTGASPCTSWLQGSVALDKNNFILTGRDLENIPEGNPWPLERDPHMLETSLPAVFAVGDVRSGNVKRVASAVGEGAIVIHMVHRTLAEM
ncbi:MAG: FAD-dependent oxidoreductase [Bryobacteraceae bacterium]|nr:FAD-dependent oxidoreductase [Bryobacteraceae bacterium]